MDDEAFKRAYSASRNGTDKFNRQRLYPKFLYSDGVKECCEAGCYWLLDILGTELPQAFRNRPDEPTCLVTAHVKGGKASIVGEFHDHDTSPWTRQVSYTDMPDGDWQFYVSRDNVQFYCILLTEY